MTLGMAKIVEKTSKVFLCFALASLISFFVSYFRGSIEFKFVSLPVMFCIVSVTWFAMAKMAVITMENEKNETSGEGDKKN